MWQLIKPSRRNLRVWQLGLLLLVFIAWHVLTAPGLVKPFLFDNDQQAAFFFGEPLKIFQRIWGWFFTSADIYVHLWITLLETVLANARMLGAGQRQLLRHVYLPSATSWVFSSLHTSVGLAFVGAVVGEYLGSSQGVGYLILQAEGSFDINTVMAGILVLTAFALLLDALVGQVERRLMKWQPKAGETERL
jgi:ABC-type nitrate/sulfonate/bicarbonate transport system permease component